VDGKDFTVTKLDDLTIQVVTPEIYAPFLTTFGAGVPIMPKHILDKSVADGTFASAYGINSEPSGHRRQRAVSSLKEYKAGAIYNARTQSVFF
jgi:ABC-type transport system substrate-binding protein